MEALSRTAPWVTLAGALIMLAGLGRDVQVHRLDPALAAREGIFSLAAPAHATFAVGLALVVISTVMFLVGRATRASRLLPRLLSGGVALLLVLMSLNVFVAAARGGGHDGHAHPGDAPSPPAHATPAQQAAATHLLQEVKASLRRFENLQAAQAAGYRQVTPFRFLRWGPAHFHNRSLHGDDGLLDPARPEALVYMKLPDGRHVLLGAMFLAPQGKGPRPGGPLTAWHVHDNLCVTATGAVALARGGVCPPGTFFVGDAVEMMHVWIFDHPDGPFAHELTPEAIRAALRQSAGR